MKKVIYNAFGDESVLEITDQPVPAPEKDQVLIKVKAVSINPLDWKIYGGEMKLMSGSKFPKSIGIDFAGSVVTHGANINRFKEGDEVMGIMDVFKGGALAEYLVVKEADLSIKPKNITFAEAAALPLTGLSAIQIIDQLAGVNKNQEVLINGASGGIGIFAVQIAKKRGAHVTAVVGTKSVAAAEEWGADQVIDHNKQSIQQFSKRFDAVIDLSAKLSFKAGKKLMKSRAVFITTLPSPLTLIGSFFNNLFFGKKLKVLIVKPTVEKFETLRKLADKDLQIVLDKTYAFDQVRAAYKESSLGKIIGKSVILID
ncbi:MAG: NAD(P)-dependent alcohol dehydrogenase [Mucilaginibacter sp.]